MKTPKLHYTTPLLALLILTSPILAWPRFPDRPEEIPEAASSRSQIYRDAQRALDLGDWSGAEDLFSHIAEQGGSEADAALYWQAWAQHKNGRSAVAAQTLRKLESRYPDSSWIDDARALH